MSTTVKQLHRLPRRNVRLTESQAEELPSLVAALRHTVLVLQAKVDGLESRVHLLTQTANDHTHELYGEQPARLDEYRELTGRHQRRMRADR
jgi:hypothetical protein